MLVPSTTALPRLASGISVLSYNVLLPNSCDGWWLYKYYDDVTPRAATLWSARAALLRDRVLSADADVVLLQECSAESFDTDWSFLSDAGYDCALYKSGRMRPATFWKADLWERCDAAGGALAADDADGGIIMGDRTLTTMLRPRIVEPTPPTFIVNCHLSAGPERPCPYVLLSHPPTLAPHDDDPRWAS